MTKLGFTSTCRDYCFRTAPRSRRQTPAAGSGADQVALDADLTTRSPSGSGGKDSGASGDGVVTGVSGQAGTFPATVDVRDSASPQNTASTTFTYTITGGPNPCGDLVENGGFEYGTNPWTWSSFVLGNTRGQTPHAGNQYAWLNGYGELHTDTLSQRVTIPAGCRLKLNYYLHIDSAETTTTFQNDKLTLTANGTTLATFSNLNKAPGYTLRTADLSAHAGQTVTLAWTGTENSSLRTNFVIDDVSTS